jgi:hypothetical protein
MDNKSTTCDEEDSSGNDNQTKSFMSKNDTEDKEEAVESNGQELQSVRTNKEKVVPLYTPDDAVVNVFMIHGSQKSALALATFSLGFQQQVYNSYSFKLNLLYFNKISFRSRNRFCASLTSYIIPDCNKY